MPDETIQSLREPASFKRVPPATPQLVAVIRGDGGKLDALDRREVLELMHKHGVVLFRGFSVEPEDFVRFSARFCTQFLEHVSRKLRPNRNEDGTVAQVLTGNGSVTLHGEMNYVPMRPDVLWFHCIKPPRKGGETLVADSRQVLGNLSDATRRMFEARPIRYRHVVGPEIWRNTFKEAPREAAVTMMNFVPGVTAMASGEDDVQMDFETDAIRPTGRSGEPGFINSIENVIEYADQVQTLVTFDDGEPIPDAVLREIRSAGDASLEPIRWEAQDLIMIDNSRVMHGRAAFEGDERRIDVRFGMLAPEDK